jgi:hypothetical protein
VHKARWWLLESIIFKMDFSIATEGNIAPILVRNKVKAEDTEVAHPLLLPPIDF